MSTVSVKSNPWKSRQEYRHYCKRENADFLQDMQGRALVQYLRSPGRRVRHSYSMKWGWYYRGAPQGVMVAYRDSLGYIRYGFYFQHSKEKKAFDKPIGLRKAIERAEVNQTADEKPYAIPTRYEDQIDKFKCYATERLTTDG